MSDTKKIRRVPVLPIIALFVIVVLTNVLSVLTYGADSDSEYRNVYADFLKENPNAVQVVWNGADKMKAGYIYTLEKKVSLTITRVVPRGAMLVIRGGGRLTVETGGGALYSEGTFAVEYGGVLELRSGGKFVLNSSGAAGLNGGFYIDAGSTGKIYSKLFLYRDGSISLSGSLTVYNAGQLFYENDIKNYSGKFEGKKTRITGAPTTPLRTQLSADGVSFLRFYNRDEAVTYRVSAKARMQKIISGYNKITLYPLREGLAQDADFSHRYGIRLYNSYGAEILYIERPSSERAGIVCVDGFTYSYDETGMTYDEFYYYALGVIEHN